MMTSSAVKLDLIQTNIAAKKRNIDLAFLLGGADMLQGSTRRSRRGTWRSVASS